MSVIRKAQGQEFTVLPNETIRDPNLSLDALGLLVKLISRPPNWEVRPHQLQKECRVGRDRLRRMLSELEESGFLVRSKCRNPDGTWDWVSEVYQESQTPVNQTDNTNNGFPGHGSTIDGFSGDGSSTGGPSVAGKHGDIKKKVLKKTESKKQTRETALTLTRHDLLITDEMRDWAASVTPLVSLEWESQIFVDHPSGQSQTYPSQDAIQGAWRTWMMRGQRYAERDQALPQGRSDSTRQTRTRSLVEDLTDTSWAHGGW